MINATSKTVIDCTDYCQCHLLHFCGDLMAAIIWIGAVHKLLPRSCNNAKHIPMITTAIYE
ncbi:hypothetical protein BCY88_04640 [Paraburkholderia fungorum]|uniref:Uncharacterized protein n=1 Tax=Paraburkholderia fungorum TaxID=134537 RepID=A0A420GNM6_9BURK|nr:hypothetical protein BCY88_04640 [Paraburkholderia fungorum]